MQNGTHKAHCKYFGTQNLLHKLLALFNLPYTQKRLHFTRIWKHFSYQIKYLI